MQPMPKYVRPVKPEGAGETGHSSAGMAGFDIGLRLVVAVAGLGGLGLLADRLLGTLPWLMLLGMVLGFGGWMVSVARRGKQ